jgi:aldehyde dehydrogenase (NAD+)
MEREYLNLIGGQWTPAAAGTTNPDRNPARSEEVVAVVPLREPRGRDARRGSGGQGLPGWARTPMPKRSEILLKAAALLEQRLDEVAEALTREEGKTLAESKGETARGVSLLRYYAGEALQPTGEVYGSAVPTTLLFADACSRGSGRPHHALELPGGHPHLEGRPRPRLRQHGRAQAGGADAADRLAPRGRAAPGGPAAGRPEPRGRTRVTDRTDAGGEPAHQGHQLHGLERRGRGLAAKCAERGIKFQLEMGARTP